LDSAYAPPLTSALAAKEIMTRIFFVITFLIISSSQVRAETESHEMEFREPIFPIILGAALITWGAYELGGDTDEGQRNVGILWGGALVASAGIVIYQSTQDKDIKLTVQPILQRGASVVYNYRF